MENDTVKIDTTTASDVTPVTAPVTAAVAPASVSNASVSIEAPRGDRRGPGGQGGAGGMGGRRPSRRPERSGRERIKPEFDTKIINIRRVTRVAAGGRRFSFSVAVVSGDHKGRVGVGLGKAGDTSLAIDKATRNAKKNMFKVPLLPTMSISHAIEAKYSSAVVSIMPAKGRGVVAGSAVRNVIELAGIKDVVAKLRSGSKNKLNIARATVMALGRLSATGKPARFAHRIQNISK
jgi:small subunit ribosomal protein S5